MSSIYDFLNTEASSSTTGGVNTAEGQDPSTVNDGLRQLKQIIAAAVDDHGAVNTVAGTGDAVTVTLGLVGGANSITAYATGQMFRFIAGAANTGAATMNVNGIGAKAIRKISGGTDVALAAGDLAAGETYLLIYRASANAAAGAWLIIGSSAAITFATNAQAVTGTSTVLSVNPANLAATDKLVAGALPTIANNGSDATNDIDFSAGSAFDINASTAPYFATCAAMTKRLDADWSAGTGNGMRYSGAAIANTTYHLWAVWKDDGTQDYYADPSATYATVLGHLQAETGGADYTHMRRIGSIVRTGAAIKAFTQRGDQFLWDVTAADASTATPANTNAASLTLTVPTGITVEAIITARADYVTVAGGMVISSLAVSDQVPGGAVITMGTASTSTLSINNATVRTNTSGQVRFRSNTTGSTYTIGTIGWLDDRGRSL